MERNDCTTDVYWLQPFAIDNIAYRNTKDDRDGTMSVGICSMGTLPIELFVVEHLLWNGPNTVPTTEFEMRYINLL